MTDRVASSLLLLFGQNMTRIAALTTSQVTSGREGVTIQLGRRDLPVPRPLGDLLLKLIADGKPCTGIGSPPGDRKWLFPGLLPGRPITAARLADRLRALGIPVRAGAEPPSPTSPRTFPQPYSPTPSDCTPRPPSTGHAKPETGTATPPS